MRESPILMLLLMAIVSGATAGRAAPEANAGYRVILFGAHWCAPCMIEYRSLPAIAPAATPDRIVLAWTDRPIAAPEALKDQVDVLPVPIARQLATRILGEGYGLPTTVVLDAAGAVCAVWRAPLRADEISRMRAQCRAAAGSVAGALPSAR